MNRAFMNLFEEPDPMIVLILEGERQGGRLTGPRIVTWAAERRRAVVTWANQVGPIRQEIRGRSIGILGGADVAPVILVQVAAAAGKFVVFGESSQRIIWSHVGTFLPGRE